MYTINVGNLSNHYLSTVYVGELIDAKEQLKRVLKLIKIFCNSKHNKYNYRFSVTLVNDVTKEILYNELIQPNVSRC